MKRLTLFLTAGLTSLAVAASYAGDYHTTGSLKCAQCHTMHASQQHGYTPSTSADFTAIVGGPHDALLRNKVNELCLSCHNPSSAGGVIDVFNSTPEGAGELREAGGLNVHAGAWTTLTNETGYDEMNGHSLYSNATAPGGTFASSEGLNCVDCHMPHGHVPTQWRNLWTSTIAGDKFQNKPLTYGNNASANDKGKDIWEVGSRQYAQGNVWFNEPDPTKSAYANWCQSCHTHFHGASGTGTDVGGQSGGYTFASPVDWVRHPQADVNIGHLAGADYISSLTQYQSKLNKVKVMSNSALSIADYNAGPADATPSCFSCHKGHGNKNGFGLILLKGDGTALSEEGDVTGVGENAGGHPRVPTALCQQCHIQG